MRISDWSSDVCSPDLPIGLFFMNLQQFRFVRETIRRNFNLTEAARTLYTSQPGVSKAIIEFEDELGVKIFERHGKRIKGLTKPGQVVAQVIDRIMREAIGREHV